MRVWCVLFSSIAVFWMARLQKRAYIISALYGFLFQSDISRCTRKVEVEGNGRESER